MKKNFIKPFTRTAVKLSVISTLIIAMTAEVQASPVCNVESDSHHVGFANKYKAIPISGTVRDAKGQAIPGASVVIKGTTTGVSTDVNGYYKISVPDQNAVLVFSSLGFTPVEQVVGNKTAYDIILQENGKNLDEVIVVAFGTAKRSTNPAAVSTVKGDILNESPTANITQSLGGNVAGIISRSNGGAPGADNNQIYVRGIGTNSAANNPLIVIDGIARNNGNINQIDPDEIESVTVLKDAAAVAPYGIGGANGVILITTKRGKTGAPTLSFGSYYGIQNATYVPKPLNAQDYMSLTNEAYLNDGGSPTTLPYASNYISSYAANNAANPDLYPISNAIGILHKNNPEYSNNVQLSGGTKDVKYLADVSMFNQQGAFTPVSYRRYAYDLNLDVNATATTTVKATIHGSFENRNSMDPQNSIRQMYRGLLKYIPNQALQYSNGGYGASAGNSPLGVLNSGGYDRISYNTELMTLGIEQKLPFVPGLSISADFSYDPQTSLEKQWHQPYNYEVPNIGTTPLTFSPAVATAEGAATQNTSLRELYTANSTYTYHGFINYHNSFGKNEFTGLLAVEEQNTVHQDFNASAINYAVPIDELNFASSNTANYGLGGSGSTTSQIGYVYRLDYAYDGKYLLQATGRYDGSFYFAPGHQYGYFPAFAAGWVISKEKFMSDVKFVDYLKLRGSWGKTGNVASAAYQYLPGYTLYGNSYAFNGTAVQGSYQPIDPNPNITWEVATKADVGLDATLFKGLITVGIDYFTERRTGMLLAPAISVPQEYGLALGLQNAGIMDNHGIEVTMSTQHKFANGIAVSLNGNFTYAQNKLIQIFESATTYNNPNRRQTGRQLNEAFGLKALGLFSTADDKNGDGVIDAKDGYTVTQFGTLHPGDIKYQDTNGDGKIDQNDQVPIGNPQTPLITYGFTPTVSYKGIDLSLFFQGNALESFNVQGFQTIPFDSNNSNSSYEYYNNRWTPTHQNALFPRADSAPTANNTQTSSFWQYNTGYLRLKTAQLGYTFPSAIAKKIGMTRLRVYATAQNYLTFSKLTFEDPELNGETNYPNQKIFTMGLNASF
jgi:TonB-linked SusC/RagA family outer membrane protein